MWIAVAGALGTLARYGLTEAVKHYTGLGFPWGTFVVNTTGCFLFGMVWAMADERGILSSEARLILLTGFMGAFTTFSTFIFETGSFLAESRWLPGIGNIILSLAVGLAALSLGLSVGRSLG